MHICHGYLETTYQVTRSPAPGGQSGTDARGRGLCAGGTTRGLPTGSRAASPETCLGRRQFFGGQQLSFQKRGLWSNKLRKPGVTPCWTGGVSAGLARALTTTPAPVNAQHGGRVCSMGPGLSDHKPLFLPEASCRLAPFGKCSGTCVGWGVGGVSPGIVLRHGSQALSGQDSGDEGTGRGSALRPPPRVLARLVWGGSKARLSPGAPSPACPEGTRTGALQSGRRRRGHPPLPPTPSLRAARPRSPASARDGGGDAAPASSLGPGRAAHQAEMSIWQVLEDIQTSSTRRNWK